MVLVIMIARRLFRIHKSEFWLSYLSSYVKLVNLLKTLESFEPRQNPRDLHDYRQDLHTLAMTNCNDSSCCSIGHDQQLWISVLLDYTLHF